MPTSESHLVTIEELLLRPEDPLEELVEGVLHRKGPRSGRAVVIGSRVARALVHHTADHPESGAVLVGGAGYVVGRSPASVLAPLIGVVPPVVFAAMSASGNGYVEGAPIVAVEVQDHGDDGRLISRKAELLLAGGTQEVWWVSCFVDMVTVHQRELATRNLRIVDALTSDALPGFRLELAELFA